MDFEDLEGFEVRQLPFELGALKFSCTNNLLLVSLTGGTEESTKDDIFEDSTEESTKDDIFEDSTEENTEDEIFKGGTEFEILRVSGCNSAMEEYRDIAIESETGELLGILILACSFRSFEVVAMTRPRYISYLVDSPSKSAIDTDKRHTFSSSYLLLKKEVSNVYKNEYMSSSALWGGFTHATNLERYSLKNIPKIRAKGGVRIPTPEHANKLHASVLSHDSFERFLRKYHLLELLYDYIYVLKLRTMDTSLRDFRDVMNKYQKDDVGSLKYLLNEFVQSTSDLILVMHNSAKHEDVMHKLFQEYNRASNPLNDGQWSIFIDRLKLSDLNYRADGKSFSKYNNEEQYYSVILNIVSHWIYRIRCTVAHSKIGEFLFDSSHEKFVAEVGESLIDIVIENVLTNEDFQDIVRKSEKIDSCLSI